MFKHVSIDLSESLFIMLNSECDASFNFDKFLRKIEFTAALPS
jgi:hypothetical protein